MGRIWCDDTVCEQESVLQVKALEKHHAEYARTKSATKRSLMKVHLERGEGPLLSDEMGKKEYGEGMTSMTRELVIEKEVPVYALPGSLVCS
jgi:hypothetical protein